MLTYNGNSQKESCFFFEPKHNLEFTDKAKTKKYSMIIANELLLLVHRGVVKDHVASLARRLCGSSTFAIQGDKI